MDLTDVAAAVREVTGGTVTAVDVAGHRGRSHVDRFRVHLAGGHTAFVKIALDDDAAQELAYEATVLSHLDGVHAPRLYGAGADPALIVIEDLSTAAWLPPVPDDLSSVWRALEAVRDRAFPELHVFGGLGGVSDRLPEPLAAAAGTVELRGYGLVHGDLGIDNTCLLDRRAVFVDWTEAFRGDPTLDQVTVAIDLSMAAGRRIVPPDVRDLGAWLALVAGLLLDAAERPPLQTPRGAEVRRLQAEAGTFTLGWAMDEVS